MSFATGAAANDRAVRGHSNSALPVSGLSCEDVLKKCDAALDAKNRQIEKLELGLTKQTERVADLSAQVEDKNQQLQAWYRNPFVMLSIGLVTGAAVITFAK
jgi:hypothetical protein